MVVYCWWVCWFSCGFGGIAWGFRVGLVCWFRGFPVFKVLVMPCVSGGFAVIAGCGGFTAGFGVVGVGVV